MVNLPEVNGICFIRNHFGHIYIDPYNICYSNRNTQWTHIISASVIEIHNGRFSCSLPTASNAIEFPLVSESQLQPQRNEIR